MFNQGFGSAFFFADPDPDPGKKFHADPDPCFISRNERKLMRIRIRPGQKHADPCGSGSGSETLINIYIKGLPGVG